jgi:Spy/CpxP family protein refolding chaperone
MTSLHDHQYVACQLKRYAILTPEQQAIHEAKLKANREAGKKGSDVLDGMLEELHFTPEQRKQWDEIQSKKAAIGIKMNAALRGVLNAEQQAKYGLKEDYADKKPYAN